MKKNK